ncbi:hypothetical protein DHW03_02365 [Pedobacter yonginense]|uniref:Uncharacterized protein n=1 Tax=Pedobacter yonginense TaxID=651869 RepID=A0A317EPD8_9SPHI|nr:hypothetical protein [Pedobacter yonginense]PWS28711.1 hypothetical protein DHW03_02365 [Pedobacter yonginense]
MEFQNDKNNNNFETSSNAQSVNINFSQLEHGINEISSSFWDEINQEMQSNDLPLWRMWR